MAKRKIFTNIGGLMTLQGAMTKQGRLVQDSDLGWISKAHMMVENGRIIWVGPKAKAPSAKAGDVVHDCRGAYIYPGFIDAHTHLIFAGDRRDEFELRNQGVTYQQIAAQGGGILKTVAATRKASPARLLELAQERIDFHLRQGVTTVEVKSGYGLDRATEMKLLRVANALQRARVHPTYLGAHAVPPSSTAASYLQNLRADLKDIRKKGLAQRVDIFVEKGYFSLEDARDYLGFAKELGFDLTVHADQLSPMGATQLAAELGARSADHMICLSEEEKDNLRAFPKFTAMLLPIADYYLKCAYPDARGLIQRGIRVALATDFNPGSSPSQSLALLGHLARLQMGMSLAEVFSALTVGGAFALGVEREQGALATGFHADFFLCDWHWQEFFYDLRPLPVRATFVGGKRVWSRAPL